MKVGAGVGAIVGVGVEPGGGVGVEVGAGPAVGVGVGVEVGVGIAVGPDTLISVSVSPVVPQVSPSDKSAVAHTAVAPPATAVTIVE